MDLLVAVINDEHLLDELLTGWMDLGLTGATVVESTGALQIISEHVPIFAGFRSMFSGGTGHSKTVFTVVTEKQTLDSAVAFLQALCKQAQEPSQGVYFVAPLASFGRLGPDQTDG